MTLEEAIKHCLEVAEEQEKDAEYHREWHENYYEKDCRECAAYHRQLAEWLTELKEARAELDRLYPILENARILANAVIELKEKLFDKHLNK